MSQQSRKVKVRHRPQKLINSADSHLPFFALVLYLGTVTGNRVDSFTNTQVEVKIPFTPLAYQRSKNVLQLISSFIYQS